AAPPDARLFAPQGIPARQAIEAHCCERGVSLEFVAPLAKAPLAGAHQCANAALAVRLAHDVGPISDDQARAGLAAAHWPGRLEVINKDPLIVIDVGHTPDAIRAALDGFTVLRASRHGVLVCGVSQDKKAAQLIRILAPAFDTIICATAA